MNDSPSKHGRKTAPVRRLYSLLAPRAYTVIMFGALFCTLAVKLFHAWRIEMLGEYFRWILTDIAVLLGLEVIFALLVFRWPRKWLIRTVCICAAVMCTWSVMNAGWLVRPGTHILPTVLLPLVRDPMNALHIIGISLEKMPSAGVILLAPSAVALAFFFSVLAKPAPPRYNRKNFTAKITISIPIILIALFARVMLRTNGSPSIASQGLQYNCQLRAVASLFFPESSRLTKTDLENARRKITAYDEIQLSKKRLINHNIVLVVLEGIQYKYTSLYDRQNNLTPFLASLSHQGAEFTNARSTLTHTTKVLFTLLTGSFPSVSQDIVETVPADKPYASIATILKYNAGFRTAFFQSAKGNFEARPGLVHNLGFDRFWSRDDLMNTDDFLGYLACDEFAMLTPIVDWIQAADGPFFLTLMLSVTHDPYEVPHWFAQPAKEPLERYEQAIRYTDKFIAALDIELAKLKLTNDTIFCVIGDHGEAFGEHGLLGHERIPFDEGLRIPFCLRAPFLVQPQTKITRPVSSVDLAPTLLTLLGFDTEAVGFDGVNALGHIPEGREVYFSGWLRQSPSGFVKENRKFIYYPTDKRVSVYDLRIDPFEQEPLELSQQHGIGIVDDILSWREDTIFLPNQQRIGEMTLFENWLCKWDDRIASARYQPDSED